MRSNTYFKDSTRGLRDLPTVYRSSPAVSDLEVRRYQKKEEMLKQILLARRRNRISVRTLEEYLSGHLTAPSRLNTELFTELFNESGFDVNGFISM